MHVPSVHWIPVLQLHSLSLGGDGRSTACAIVIAKSSKIGWFEVSLLVYMTIRHYHKGHPVVDALIDSGHHGQWSSCFSTALELSICTVQALSSPDRVCEWS